MVMRKGSGKILPTEGAGIMDTDLTVERIDIAELGKEHFANCVLRAGEKGDYAVAWGEPIIEMPLGPNAAVREVVPSQHARRYSNGGCAIDLDDDGVDEIVVARGPEPGTEPESPSLELLWFDEVAGVDTWEAHLLAAISVNNAWQAPHDIVPFRTSIGDCITGVALILGREELLWYEVPGSVGDEWIRHEIGQIPAPKQSGLCVGDVAGNSRPDIVCGMFWAECPEDPRTEGWTIHRYGTFDDNDWGGMAKTTVTDMNGDGRAEIIATEAEIPDGRLAIFQRTAEHPDDMWNCHVLADSLYAPHSLIITDLDGNGFPDIVVGEMECAGWDFERIENPQIFAWLNRGDLQFDRITLAEHAGIHEMSLAEGKTGETILFGCNETQPQKLEDMETTVYMLRVEP